jgi:hypothetical protein
MLRWAAARRSWRADAALGFLALQLSPARNGRARARGNKFTTCSQLHMSTSLSALIERSQTKEFARRHSIRNN